MIPATPIRREGHILITGGAGFLGTNIAEALASRGEDVLVFDNLSREHVRENLTWLTARHPAKVKAAIADVRDLSSLAHAANNARAVIHLAAQVAVTTSIADPLGDFDINARGTLNVLETIRKYAPEAPLLFSSTNKVYGKRLADDEFVRQGMRYRPRRDCYLAGFGEETPLSLFSPYGCSKGAADQYVLDYSRVFGLKTVVLRMSCLYGPHQYGTEDQGWLAHFLIRALSHQPIAIYGDGYQLRDVLYVEDAVKAYLLCLDKIETVAGRAFNLGGGPQNCLSLRELLARIALLTAEEPAISFHPWRPGDQLWYVSNTKALTEATQWQAVVDPNCGLERLHNWVSSRWARLREAVA